MEYVNFLSDHPQYAGAILIVLMMLESSPVIGFFLPGTIILPLLGAAVASSDNSFGYLFICAVTGAFLGDILGFWLGRLGAQMGTHKWEPQLFNNHRQRTTKRAHELLQRHGLLALFLGRFVWLIHPAIPGAAGLLGVKTSQFIPVDLLAIFFWVLLYMGAGHILTGLWLQQTIELAEALGLVITVLLILWGMRHRLPFLSRRSRKKTADQQYKK
jgi:membrane protein DedA with SNARE-associated domain